MRRVLVLCLALAATSACGTSNGGDDGRVSVVASFYPVAEAATRVGGEHVRVTNLTPAGVEPHDLELSADEVDGIEDADLLLYVGAGFQPAIASVAQRRDGPTVDVARGLVKHAADHGHDDDESDHEHGTDVHFWLDPTLMAQAVDRVADGLSKADPDHAEAYAANAAAYKRELTSLDADYDATLSQCARNEILTAHAAFHYLADRYGLEEHAISGVEPGSEPDPKHLAELADLVRRDGITTIFYEDLVPRGFAETLARETGARTAVLSPLEGLSKREQGAGETYVTVMRRNLSALASALGCPPPPAAP